MSRTLINVAAVMDASSHINSAKASVSSAKSAFTQTRYSIDGKIQNRSDIRNRLSMVQNQLSNIDGQIGKIRSTVQSGAELYRSTDDRVESWRGNIRNAVGARASSGSTRNWGAQFKDTDEVETGLGFLSGIAKGIGKYKKSDKATLSSAILSYLDTLHDVFLSKKDTKLDATSSLLSLFKSSAGVEKGLFNYYQKTLHPYQAAKLDAKFGKTMTGLGIASDIAGVANAAITAYQTSTDADSTAYDKAAAAINVGSPLLSLGGHVYIASKCSTKTLQFVSSTTKSGKAINQILDQPTLQYTTSKAVATKVKNVNAVVTIGSAAVSSIAAGVKQYGEVTADGKLDMGDVGSVGINVGLSGLDSMASSLTFGLIDIDAEKVADDLEADAETFAKGDSWAAKYMRNQDNPVAFRFGVAIGSGAYLLGENVVEGAANGAKALGSWISQGWNSITGAIGFSSGSGGGGFR